MSTQAVLLSVEQDHEDFGQLIAEIGNGAAINRFGAVISTPPHLIDRVFARAPSPNVIQLCEPNEAELLAATATAASRKLLRLRDGGRGTARLQQLSEEVGRIATILARISEEEEAKTPTLPLVNHEPAQDLTASAVRAMIRARRLRDQYFPSDLFADPAWDMLLDLMAARLDGQRVAVSSLCIAAAVPATTALRWIKTLTDYGLFVRAADPHDGRRVFIELSDQAAAHLTAYLKAVQRLSPFAI
ncbi:MAG TPA: winged helix DNA-binding protein [Allosphingosinicella sp.]|uniref:winged helix DNA-binding protein n=1 Tax=Allosphingosinicella sp. TaxID=2823234 RepID=UPI002EDA3507